MEKQAPTEKLVLLLLLLFRPSAMCGSCRSNLAREQVPVQVHGNVHFWVESTGQESQIAGKRCKRHIRSLVAIEKAGGGLRG